MSADQIPQELIERLELSDEDDEVEEGAVPVEGSKKKKKKKKSKG